MVRLDHDDPRRSIDANVMDLYSAHVFCEVTGVL